MNAVSSGMTPDALTLNPSNLGSCPTMTVRARPFRYPIMVGLEIRSAMNPEPGHRGQDHDRGNQDRQHGGERNGPLRAAVRASKGQDRGRDHRAERGVWAEHEDPGRAENRQHQAGDEVLGQPLAPVGPEHGALSRAGDPHTSPDADERPASRDVGGMRGVPPQG